MRGTRKNGRTRVRLLALAVSAALLAACGGGGSSNSADTSQAASCSLQDQRAWLRDYMADWYLWYAASPKPEPSPYGNVYNYFQDLLYTGSLSGIPADRWSFMLPASLQELFFGEGQDMGYGVFVAGLEIEGRPDKALRVRYVEPLSPAAMAGVLRGEEIVSANGRTVSQMVSDNDFSPLSALAPGERLTMQVRGVGGTVRTVVLMSAVYALTPVSNASIIDTGSGRRTGYIMLKDFVDQALPALESAFANFKSVGVDDLVLDLRYNGGGLVSTANTLASYVAGSRASGEVFASLLFNDRHSDENTLVRFGSMASALGVSRVYVLSGPRTCSASELVVNGLRPFVDVVMIGGTTCGKPVGFVPASHCGITFDAVNFESVNARGEGRYFNGLQPTCTVADDLDHTLGSPAEALLDAARYHAANGACPAGTAAVASGSTARPMGFRSGSRRQAVSEPGEHSGMVLK